MGSDKETPEKCVRCVEEGPDLRYLRMACLYAMEEMGLPFDQYAIFGQFLPKVGEEENSFGPIPIYEEPDPDIEPYKFQYYSLRVCKGCRASWMKAIKEWFKNAIPFDEKDDDSPNTGIFVRELGVPVEITEKEFNARRKREPRS